MLSNAILANERELFFKLLKTEDLNASDRYGLTPLIQTVIVNNLEFAEILVKKGADVNKRDHNGWSALYWAVDINNLNFCSYLLSCGASANIYSKDGMPLMVLPYFREQRYIVNELTKQGANLRFCKDFIALKLLSHRYELKGKGDLLNAQGKFIEIDLEGFMFEFTTDVIKRSIYSFTQKSDNLGEFIDPLSRVSMALDTCSKLVQKKYKEITAEHLLTIREHANDELLIIPVSYQGHAITFVKYKDLFCKVDRGVKKSQETVVIYKLGNTDKFNGNFIYDLIYKNKSKEYLIDKFKDELELTAFANLDLPKQITGNCSFANVEAAVPTALFVLMLEDYEHNKLKTKIMALFASWIDFDRLRILRLSMTLLMGGSDARKATFAQCFGQILASRLDPNKKTDNYIAKIILQLLNQKHFSYVLESYFQAYPQGSSARNNLEAFIKQV